MIFYNTPDHLWSGVFLRVPQQGSDGSAAAPVYDETNCSLAFRYAPHQKPPLCKGRCQPNRLTEGLLRQAATNSHWFSAKTQYPPHNPSVKTGSEEPVLPAPFTQGSLGRCRASATNRNLLHRGCESGGGASKIAGHSDTRLPVGATPQTEI